MSEATTRTFTFALPLANEDDSAWRPARGRYRQGVLAVALITLYLCVLLAAPVPLLAQAAPVAPAAPVVQPSPVVPQPTPVVSTKTEAQPNITWSLGSPPERLRYPANSEVRFTATAGEQDIKGLQLAQSTLQDPSTLLQLDASQLTLSKEDGTGGSSIEIPKNSTIPLKLKIAPSFSAPGVFAGDISFRIDGKPETQSFKLTVYSRSVCAMLLGGALIAVGLGLYFVVNVYLRRSTAIDDALFPAYQLRDTVAVLRDRLVEAQTQTRLPLAELGNVLRDIDDQLSPEKLAPYLPAVLISPSSSTTDWLANFRAYLTPISSRTAAMVVLINSGMRDSIISYWAQYPAAVTTALDKIDAVAVATLNADQAQTQLAPILQELQAAAKPPQAELTAFLASAPSGAVARFFILPPDTHTLQVRMLRNALWVWWLVALIALVSGFYSLVLQNFGFGSWADYIKCFFWGLGFSVAGTQLEQLTQTGVTSNFGISIPKA